jgi:hypothetical protein
LAQPHDPHLAVHIGQTAVHLVGDQEPDRVGAAVDRRHPAHARFPVEIRVMTRKIAILRTGTLFRRGV